jgi:transposase
MLTELVEVVIGVDTHARTHTAAVVDAATGALRETLTVAADPTGYQDLLFLGERHGGLRAFAIEGAGGYGVGLTRHLQAAGETVVEIDRPKRPTRRGGRKTDLLDAERAARDAMSRARLAAPKTGGRRAALAMLLAARRTAVESSADAQRQLRALVLTAPEPVRARFRGHRGTPAQVQIAADLDLAALAADTDADTAAVTAATVLGELARRIRALGDEAARHEKTIRAIVTAWAPQLLTLPGLGAINAAVVLTAWSHPGRCRHDGAFAMLAGAAPIPVSSGDTERFRLNRAGDRQLNRALHNIVLTRQRCHQPTHDYTTRRRAEGKTDREIRRCLKRYIARQLYRTLEPTTPTP